MLVYKESMIWRQDSIPSPYPDQVCIVTGGDSGIGRSVAAMFARESAKCVAIVYLDKEQKVGCTVGWKEEGQQLCWRGWEDTSWYAPDCR